MIGGGCRSEVWLRERDPGEGRGDVVVADAVDGYLPRPTDQPNFAVATSDFEDRVGATAERAPQRRLLAARDDLAKLTARVPDYQERGLLLSRDLPFDHCRCRAPGTPPPSPEREADRAWIPGDARRPS